MDQGAAQILAAAMVGTRTASCNRESIRISFCDLEGLLAKIFCLSSAKPRAQPQQHALSPHQTLANAQILALKGVVEAMTVAGVAGGVAAREFGRLGGHMLACRHHQIALNLAATAEP